MERSIQVHHVQSDDRVLLTGLKENRKRKELTKDLQHTKSIYKTTPPGGVSVYLRVVILLPHGVERSCEHGQLHPGNQAVVDGGVRQPGSIRGPPVSHVGAEDLLCESEHENENQVKICHQSSTHYCSRTTTGFLRQVLETVTPFYRTCGTVC